MVPLTRTRHKLHSYHEQSPIMVPPVVPVSPYIALHHCKDLLKLHHAGTTTGKESRCMVPPLAPLYRITPYIMIHLRSPSDGLDMMLYSGAISCLY